MRVLIAEDDPIFRRYLQELLRREGFATVVADNADDAVNLAKDHHPQMILLDFSLAQRRGGELKDATQIMRILRKDSSTRDACMMIITGQDRNLVDIRVAESDLDPAPLVFSKPVDQEALLKQIRTAQVERTEETPVS